MDVIGDFLANYGIPFGLLAYLVYWLTNTYTRKIGELKDEIRGLRSDIRELLVDCIKYCRNGDKAEFMTSRLTEK